MVGAPEQSLPNDNTREWAERWLSPARLRALISPVELAYLPTEQRIVLKG